MRTNKILFWIGLLLLAFALASFVMPGSRAQDNAAKQQASLIHVQPLGYKPAPETTESRQGKVLFANLNCAACHSIDGAGGCLGPVLDGVGAHRTGEYMLARLSKDPLQMQKFEKLTKVESPDLMPHPRLSDSNARKLVAYLLTLPEPAKGYQFEPHKVSDEHDEVSYKNEAFKPQPKNASSQAGSNAYYKLGCAACHSIGGIGGWFGPPLDGIGARHSVAYIKAHIRNPQEHQKAMSRDEFVTQMPNFMLDDKQVEDITNYLLTLPASP
jgi:mono/diheme cytochrome c family protein